jgi:hypothetical protein
LVVFGLSALAACIVEPPPLPPPLPIAAMVKPDEHHLSEIVQLTFGGENTGSRWSWAGKQVLMQSPAGEQGCEHIQRTEAFASAPASAPVKPGDCASFAPGDDSIVYARAPKCTQPPEAAKGGRPLDPELDLYRAKADGSGETRLTETPGYDGEPNVCGKDGSIVFTSMRDGDLDLYRMDADGSNVKRLTATLGYDGDAAFDSDCSHVVWVASRPRGRDLDDYTKQLADKLLQPKMTDLWVANADGTEARQISYLDAVVASPAWMPGYSRIVFTSGYGSNNLREVDLWALDVDGTGLERVTTAPGYDGSGSFTPDGKFLAFSSARATLLGRHDVNVFVAKWGGASRRIEERPADHLMGDSAWLADKAREGRGLGTKGLEDSGAYMERSFKSFGLAAIDGEDYRQEFDVPTKVVGQVAFNVGGGAFDPRSLRALGFSSSGSADGPLFYVGSNDDFARVDAKGKIIVVRQSGRSSLQYTAWLAHDRGAAGLIVVADAALPDPAPDSSEGMPAAMIAGDVARPLVAMLVHNAHPQAHLAVTLAIETQPAFNVIGRYPASVPPEQKLPGVIVLGAHYDHIGEQSPGADDNASGTAALLAVGRMLTENKVALRRDLVLAAFSGEEQGAAGADYFVRHPPAGVAIKDVTAMVNLDMVGRLRDNTVQVFGEPTATQWPDLINGACLSAELVCVPATSGGFGAADHTSFYEAGVPVVHLFTGVHGDYLKPTDTVDKLNAAGMAQIARAAEQLARDLSDLPGRLDYQRLTTAIETDQPVFRVSLGTIPDRAGPPNGQKGMLLAGVRPGGPADKAGLKKGDVLVRLGGHVIGGIEDVMFVLTDAKPGTKVQAVVLRGGKEMPVELSLETSH